MCKAWRGFQSEDFRMKKEIAKKWVKALRSGRYKQVEGRLGSPRLGYCCLGVLCKVGRKEFSEQDGCLREEIVAWAGMKSDNGDLPVKGYKSLVVLNDDRHFNFKAIADVIEKHWKIL
jgi:hypothetical protein